MNVRVIAGEYGGRKLSAPNTSRTHPMGERIRASLFNIINDEIENAVVLDAFAGTGVIGFEALSRGAQAVTFIEKDRVAAKIIAENREVLGIASQSASIIPATVSAWDQKYPEAQFDIIFCDPPYHDVQFSTVSKLFSHLKTNGLMVLSHPGRSETPTGTGVVVVDNRSYGDAVLTFYRKVQE
ncbi:MAG TPA: 16S rRNA (guanine(966)-N(2))-methyltransferase RsmD [Candidatus Saccharimonadales bacterium]